MPFPLRTVQPTQVCRLGATDVQTPWGGPPFTFNSLQEVSSHSLLLIIRQLSDLSRLAGDIFNGIQGEAIAVGQRSARLQHRLSCLQQKVAHLDHKAIPVPVSNLDEESKWTVHYTAAWHQQENVFLPASRPPCVEDLHQQAKLNLKSVLRECDKLRRDGYRSSQYYSQGPTFSSSSSMVCTSYQEDSEEHERKFSVSSNEEERLLSNRRPKTPVPNEFSDTHTNWTKSLPLPTPEEKMRQESQAVHTDVIPINVTAGTGQIGFRGHSMHIPDNYNTLENPETCYSSTYRSDTRDFSCQTEEIKIVPPSVRRIRAQKGQGIASLMSNSSGNMSTLSDPSGCPKRPNGDLNFRSLPRPGARVCLQSMDKKQGNSDQMEDSFTTLPRQLSKLQVDDTVIHLRNNPRAGTLQRPKSQEVRGSESEVTNPACVVSPNAAYSTSVIPNALLSASSELIAIHTSQSTGHLDSKGTSQCSSSHKKSICRDRAITVRDEHHSSSGNWSENSSSRHSQTSDTLSPNVINVITLRDSAVSLNNASRMNNGQQSIPYRMNAAFVSHSQDSDTHSDSSYSDGRPRNGSITSSINSADQWSYEARESENAPSRKPSSIVSGSPVSNMSTCSSERKGDSSSLYSVDHDGYYTSMHMDSGMNSRNENHKNGIRNPRHSVINIFDKKEKKNMDDTSSYSDKSLARSISLKKPKKPPPPPSRTDSLRRPPKKNAQTNGQVLNETLIASLQQSLQLNLKSKSGSSPSQSPCSDYEDPWVLRSRSQSTVSATSSGMSATAPNMYSICAVTPSQSETSSIKSEYADQWSYVIDCSRPSDEHSQLHGVHSTNKLSGINNYNTCELNYKVRASLSEGRSGLANQNSSSPEKPCRVTSPSSGYSSQSNTPTTLTPVPLQLKNSMSPGNGKNKIKPKVPERRSSLISSVSMSSSSTSLSSNTSDSVQQSIKPPTAVLLSNYTHPTPPLTPDPPPPLVMDVVDAGTSLSSPCFPPPPPEATMFPSTSDGPLWLLHSENINKRAPINCPPPPPPLPIVHSTAAPAAPPLNIKMLKPRTKYDSAQLKNRDNRDAYNSLNNHLDKQEQFRPTAPLVTAHALQTVQLKRVKKALKLEPEKLAEQVPECKLQDDTSSSFSRPSFLPSASPDRKFNLSVRENKILNLPEQLQYSESNKTKVTTSELVAEKLVSRYKEEEYPAHDGNMSTEFEMSSPQEIPNTLQSTLYTSPNKKPPPVSKKPKLFLIVPPPQLDLAADKIAEVNENVRSMPTASECDPVSVHCEELNGREAAENISEKTEGLISQTEEASLFSCQVVEENTCFTLPPVPETPNNQKEEEQPTMSDEGKTSDTNKESASCGRKLSEEDESDVFELISTPTRQISTFTEHSEEVMTPTKPRTTEDLFAVIHRSKRKVLGRKSSDDDRHGNHSPSPPVTPTGTLPTLSSFKQTGAIQRSIRKSSTSSDNFKALLLKKGSRSECSSRMSAAEMLKHTDPRSQRSKSDSYFDLPESPSLFSPNKNKRAQDEWTKHEGLMPRSMSVSGTRYSRSRTPPSAASSKYNVRSRLQSSPMTVICEGGESAEIAESSIPKVPSLLHTQSLDSYHGTDYDINNSLGLEDSNTGVHIDLMSRLLDESTGEETCSLEEKS